MKASLIVKDPDGRLIAVGPQVHIDDESVRRERARLRAVFGPRVLICEKQVEYAREAMEQRAVA